MLRRKVTCAGALATIGLLVAVAGSQATEWTGQFDPGGSIEATSIGKVTFDGGITIACYMTFDGSLEADEFELDEETAIGEITDLSTASCSGGTFEGVLGTPWTVRLDETIGALPDELEALGVTIEGVAFNLSTFFGLVNCLYEGELEAIVELSGENAYSAGVVVFDESSELSWVRGSGACPTSGSFSGGLEFEPAQEFVIGPITVRCKEPGTEAESLDFGTVAPGGSSTLRLVCRYVFGDPAIKVKGTTGIVGRDPALFSAEGIPAPRTIMTQGDAHTITVRFEPEGGAPGATTFLADFDFVTDRASDVTPMIGRTP